MSTSQKKEKWIRKSLEKIIQLKGFTKVRANLEDFEVPTGFTREIEGNKNVSFVPDITSEDKLGYKNYFEVGLKTDKTKRLVSKWKLLSLVSRIKKGKFYLIAPRGHRSFINRILDTYHIEAEVIAI